MVIIIIRIMIKAMKVIIIISPPLTLAVLPNRYIVARRLESLQSFPLASHKTPLPLPLSLPKRSRERPGIHVAPHTLSQLI